MVGSLPNGGNRAGDGNVMAQVASVIDAGEDETRSQGKAEECYPNAICRSAVDSIDMIILLVQFKWTVCRDAVADLGLLVCWGNQSQESTGKGEHGGLSQGAKPPRAESVVIGEQNHAF